MGSEKDLLNNALEDDALETVTGGMEEVSNLVYSNKTKKKVSSTVQKGKPKLASDLLYTETKVSKKDIEGKAFSGDVLEKGTFC